MESGSTVRVIQWMVDTRPLWPTTLIRTPKEQMEEFKNMAFKALSLLPEEEQRSVLRYYYVKDAKMSLLSSLLKRYVIAKLCNISWSSITLSKTPTGKPCYTSPNPDAPSLEFNVSHQAGIVIIIASLSSRAVAPGNQGLLSLGTDIVCVNERGNDYARIESEGFFAWVDMHSNVFAPSETQALKMDVSQLDLPLQDAAQLSGYARDAIARCQYPSQSVQWRNMAGEAGEFDGGVVVEAKLRRFYALWCLREAYVKMTGEALLAEWLQQLEFRRFRTPQPVEKAGVDALSKDLEPSEPVTDIEIFFRAKMVRDVPMELRAFGRDFMIASAARLTDGDVSRVVYNEFVELDLEKDIYAIAEIES